MTQKKNQTISYTQIQTIFVDMLCLNFFGVKGIDHKAFDMNKNSRNSSKVCVLKVDLEYPTGLRELHNNYRLAPEKIKMKKKRCCLVIN